MATWKLTLLTVLLLLVWLTVAFFGAFSGWWMNAVVADRDTNGFFDYAVRTLDAANKGSSSLVLIEDGVVQKQYHTAPGGSSNANTVFAAASMSKWITAHAMMTLVNEGQADLDAPINQYLTRWTLPDSEFDNDAVTIRGLLSHTAGLGDSLGFGEYRADEPVPSLEAELAAPRASSGAPVSLAVVAEPGSEWNYSGGSYLILELLIEEISGESFDVYVQRAVFDPLGMSAAGYASLDSYDNNAGIYESDGTKLASPRYASNAATALVVSSADLTKFVLSQISQSGAASPSRLETIKSMRAPHGRTLGADIWGLGTILYAPTQGGDVVFGHDGANDPGINTAARINPDTGDALIVLASGHPSVATEIGSEWVLWQTGTPDVLATGAVIESMFVPAAIGCALILLLVAITSVRRKRVEHALARRHG